MTRIEALRALLEKVEAGEARGLYGMLSEACGLDAVEVMRADLGSLDAAKSLHEAVLPGCGWGVGDTRAGVYLNGAYLSEPVDDTPARAWLLAILRALIAQEEGTKKPGAS
jgi:hypothetical protein